MLSRSDGRIWTVAGKGRLRRSLEAEILTFFRHSGRGTHGIDNKIRKPCSNGARYRADPTKDFLNPQKFVGPESPILPQRLFFKFIIFLVNFVDTVLVGRYFFRP